MKKRTSKESRTAKRALGALRDSLASALKANANHGTYFLSWDEESRVWRLVGKTPDGLEWQTPSVAAESKLQAYTDAIEMLREIVNQENLA